MSHSRLKWKFRYSEKATKIWLIFHWHSLVESNYKWKMGQICVALSEYLIFKQKPNAKNLDNIFQLFRKQKISVVHSVFTQFINQFNETIFWEMLQCVMRYYVHSDKGEKDEVRVVRCKKLWREYTTNGLPSTKVMPATFISLFFVTTKRH